MYASVMVVGEEVSVSIVSLNFLPFHSILYSSANWSLLYSSLTCMTYLPLDVKQPTINQSIFYISSPLYSVIYFLSHYFLFSKPIHILINGGAFIASYMFMYMVIETGKIYHHILLYAWTNG